MINEVDDSIDFFFTKVAILQSENTLLVLAKKLDTGTNGTIEWIRPILKNQEQLLGNPVTHRR